VREKLATDLGRPQKSVRSSMNGPLAKAIKGALARYMTIPMAE
jgi:hypothetical protein